MFGPPVMWVAKPHTPPVIDGTIDEGEWQAAMPVTLGLAVGGWHMPSQKTEARVLADDKALYFAVRCFEAHPEQLRSATGEALTRVNTGDTVEFFLDPGHREKRNAYTHVLVTPKGMLYVGQEQAPHPAQTTITAMTGTFPGGWSVEAAVPVQDLGVTPGEIPTVWGLNITRQRPELGVHLPQAAAGAARFRPQVRTLDEPGKYRDGELSAWAPTYSDYNYADSRPFHVPQRFGHALLEVGTQPVAPPATVFELLFHEDFENGALESFKNGVIQETHCRQPGKCLSSRDDGKSTLYLAHGLEDLEDVTLIMTFRLPANGRLYYYGRAPDGAQCGADRHEIFMTHEAAAARSRATDRKGRLLFPTLDLYDTHADKMAWKPWGRLWQGPGPWALMTGYFSEPSAGSVMYPGTDWAILRTRLGLFRRYPGSRPGQNLVPHTQNYPQGLVFAPSTRPLLIDDLVIFRGTDIEPPARVTGVVVKRLDAGLEVGWQPAKDNTWTAYYQVYLGQTLMAETAHPSVRIEGNAWTNAALTVVAYDLYGNRSAPSEPVAVGKRATK
jgi:hypothetical protein